MTANYDEDRVSAYLKKLLEQVAPRFGLTSREIQILELWINDYDYKEIAETFIISKTTVRTHLQRINTKLGVSSKAAIIILLISAFLENIGY